MSHSLSRHNLIAASLVCLIGIFYLATIRVGHVWGDDQAAYIHHAKNIAEGMKYGNIGYLRSPSSIAPQMYPPIFPLLLAPVYCCYGLRLTPMKVAAIVFFCTALFLLYHLLKNEAGPWLALGTVAVIGFCPYFWDFKDILYSENPFLAFTYAALLVAKWAERYRESQRQLILFGILAGCLIWLANGTRSVGIVLVPTILVREFAVFRKLTWFGIVAGVVFVLGAIVQRLVINLESDYLGPLANVLTLKSLLGSLKYYLLCLSVLWENGHSKYFQLALYFVVSAFASYGGWTKIRKQWSVVDVFAVLYGLLIICFPWGGRRYLMPILPIYVFYFLIGLRNLSVSRPKRLRIAIQAGAVVSMVACFAAKYATVNWREVPDGTQGKEVSEMVEYVKQAAGRDGVVVFEKARFLALYADTNGLDIYETDRYDKAFDFYRQTGVTHLVVAKAPVERRNKFLVGLVLGMPGSFEKIFENTAFSVYRLAKS